MRYTITLLFITSLVTGCGGSSSKDSPQEQSANTQPVMNIDIPVSLKGRESTPELASLSASNGDTIVLNSTIHGSKEGGEDFEVFFEAQDQQHVLIQPVTYERYDPNLIFVTSVDINPYERYIDNNRNEVSFIASNRKYRTEYISKEPLEFSLRIMEASRESMGFSEHDYLIKVEGQFKLDCTGEETLITSESENLVINWHKGEFLKLSDNAASHRSNFSVRDETSFDITRFEGDESDGYSKDYQHYVSISLEDNHKISYNFTETLRYGSGETREICTTTYKSEGEIIL